MIINVDHVTEFSNVNLVINHHIKRWTMFMKAIRITDVIFVAIHFLKIVVRRSAYIQFMKAAKITNVTLVVNHFLVLTYGRGILTISFSCGEGV